jgi:hypothetical protein
MLCKICVFSLVFLCNIGFLSALITIYVKGNEVGGMKSKNAFGKYDHSIGLQLCNILHRFSI